MASTPLPSLLAPQHPLPTPDIEVVHRLMDLRRVAKWWADTDTSKLDYDQCKALIAKGMASDTAALRIVKSLSVRDLAILAVYRRYGNRLHGAVARADLLQRGLIEIVTRGDPSYRLTSWKQKPIATLTDLLYLYTSKTEMEASRWYHGNETDRPFLHYTVHPRLVPYIEPAGPPPPLIKPLKESVVSAGTSSPALLVLDLSRLFSTIVAKGNVRLTKSGELAVPALRSLSKDFATAAEEFALTEPTGFYFELLRQTGLLTERTEEAIPNPSAARDLFQADELHLVHRLATAWLHVEYWRDGEGMVRHSDFHADINESLATKQVLVWALDSLAGQGEGWYDVQDFLLALYDLHGITMGHRFGLHKPTWAPVWDLQEPESATDLRQRYQKSWMTSEGYTLANILMITLPALGLLERGRHGPKGNRLAFRLTPMGRAILGASAVEAPSTSEEKPFFIVQPNFEILAYLDQATARSSALLGSMCESGSRTGVVQSFRLTHASVYRALEGGVTLVELVDFLRRFGRGSLPANVVQTLSDWGGRHASLVLRSHVTLVGFPGESERDAWIKENKGQPLGSRFVLALASKAATLRKTALEVDHRGPLRRTWDIDEQGWISIEKPLDSVQRARLMRMAEHSDLGWRVTRISMAKAKASGLKEGWVEQWLVEHLSSALPPLLQFSFRAWLGHEVALGMGDAILLRIKDDMLFEALKDNPRMKPFIKAIPQKGWLAIHPESRKQLKAFLDELGFSLSALT